VAEFARSAKGPFAPLRAAGFHAAAELAAHLVAEADRRSRDVFGRLTEPNADRYALAWLAACAHLAATEQTLIRASWSSALQDHPL